MLGLGAFGITFPPLVTWVDIGLAFGVSVSLALWLYAAYAVLPDLTGEENEHATAWAAGAFFVPILNLFRPYTILREVAIGSDPDALELALDARREPPFLLWWVLWIGSGIALRLIDRLSEQAASDNVAFQGVALTVVLMRVVADGLVLLVVPPIDRDQQALAVRLAEVPGAARPDSAVVV